MNNSDKVNLSLDKSDYFEITTNLQLVKYLLVYTDFIEDQYFGDSRSSILRTVNIKANSNLENVTFFDNPHYLNVKKTRIHTINIEICDIYGNPIKFQDLFSNVHITLHFRPKKRN